MCAAGSLVGTFLLFPVLVMICGMAGYEQR